MIYGQMAHHTSDHDSGNIVGAEETSIFKILEQILMDERAQWWPKEESGNSKDLSPVAHNLACLATLTGGLDDGDLLDVLEEKGFDRSELIEFYGKKSDKSRDDACYLLGFSPTARDKQASRYLPAREPDLVGELMILWSLVQEYVPDQIREGMSEKSRAIRLAEHAFAVNPSAMTASLIRLFEDFNNHTMSRALRSMKAPLLDDYGQDAIVAAAYYGFDGALQHYLKDGLSADHVMDNGAFPLLQAAQNGHEPCVHLLLEKGAKPNQVEQKHGTFPLLQAAQQGHQECLKLLLAAGADPNQANKENGTFPLLMAAQNGHETCAQFLLGAGADPNQVNEQNGTFPLFMAAQNGHSDCVELLLAAGADANLVNEQTGTFPLLLAAQNGHQGCVELLLAAGADPNQLDEQDGGFPLLMAAQEGHKGCVESLLAAGADPNQLVEQDGGFPLLMAAQNGHKECVKLLLAEGADPNQSNEQDSSFPLFMAAINDRPECLKLLIDNGADVHQNFSDPRFPYSLSALVGAIGSGNESCADILREAGAKLPGDFVAWLEAQMDQND